MYVAPAAIHIFRARRHEVARVVSVCENLCGKSFVEGRERVDNQLEAPLSAHLSLAISCSQARSMYSY